MTPEPDRSPPHVTIHYLRPPDHLQTFRQPIIHQSPEVIVTFSRNIRVSSPMELDGEVVLETRSDIVWFTFPRLWHDIGRFHNAAGAFTGFYANLLTPVEMLPGDVWRTTDLFLDIWMKPGQAPKLLDEDELQDALDAGALKAGVAQRARKEAARILEHAGGGAWPPPVVHEWTRERALAVLNADSDSLPPCAV